MSEPPSDNYTPPPRAFTQGTGTIYQAAGVGLFLVMMFVCCASAFVPLESASRPDLAAVGWRLWSGGPLYSAQKATSISLAIAIGLGVAVASLGLGLQAMHRRAPIGAVLVSGFGAMWFLAHSAFFVAVLRSLVLMVACVFVAMLFIGLQVLAIVSWRDMAANPPPADLTALPEGYKIPYSHLHADPPEVRLARELEERRRKLEIQQKELEALEERIRKHRYD